MRLLGAARTSVSRGRFCHHDSVKVHLQHKFRRTPLSVRMAGETKVKSKILAEYDIHKPHKLGSTVHHFHSPGLYVFHLNACHISNM